MLSKMKGNNFSRTHGPTATETVEGAEAASIGFWVDLLVSFEKPWHLEFELVNGRKQSSMVSLQLN